MYALFSVTDTGRRVSLHQSRSRVSLENPHTQRWDGTCIHNVEPPKWAQKRRFMRADDPDADQYAYDEPRRAVAVAVNTRFSLVAVGMHW